MGRRRSHDRRDLPPNLYIRNSGYYCYRDPRTGKEFGLGRNRRVAVTEAIQANIELFSGDDRKTLVSRISSDDAMTVHSWIERYEVILKGRGLKQKTMTDYESKLRAIKDRIPDSPISEITTKHIAALLNDYVENGKHATAKLIRSTLSDIFREAIAEGHLQTNPVTATRAPKSEVKRERLTLDEYREIMKATGDLPPWVPLSIELAVITGQRVGDLCAIKWSDIHDEFLHIEQQKTGVKLAIPINLSLDSLGLVLSDTLFKCKTTLNGDTVISSTRNMPLSSGTVSRYFMRARKASGLSFGEDPPTFHELRSLSARQYEKQVSDKFAQHLLGHKSDSMASQYRDDRGREWNKLEIK